VGRGDFSKGNTVRKKPSDIGFVNFKDGDAGDYHLAPKSKYRHASTDGKDLAPTSTRLKKLQRGLSNRYKH